jgi:hypothetical protein
VREPHADEAVNPSPEGSPVARKGGRKKGWNYFTTRSEAEGELRTIVNLVKLGQIEPARANSAIYGLSTFLSSRKVAEDLSDRHRVEEMEGRVRELIEEIAANRRKVAELVERTRPE